MLKKKTPKTEPKIACAWQLRKIPEGQNLYTISKIYNESGAAKNLSLS